MLVGFIAGVVLPEFSPEGRDSRTIGQTGIGMIMWGGIIGLFIYGRRGKSRSRGFGVGCLVGLGVLSLFYVALPALTGGASTADSKLASEPVFAVIKSRDPELFRAIVVAVRKTLLEGGEMNDGFRAAGSIVAKAFQDRLRVADSGALVRVGRARLAVLQEVSRKDKSLCRDVITGKAKARDGALAAVDDATLYELTKTMAEAAVSGTGRLQPVAERDAEEVLSRVHDRLHKQLGKEATLLERLDSPLLDAEVACRVAISYYEEVLKLPVSQAAVIIRHGYW